MCANICDETLKLCKYQRTLEDKYNDKFVGKSVHDTCKSLLEVDAKEAERMKTNFKIPDRR